MNSMDVEKMEGRELDAKMAELMGWRVEKEMYSTWVAITDTCWSRPLVGPNVRMWGQWSPSTDIAAAMQVVDKMIADGWEFELQYTNVNEVEGEPLDYQWWCSFIYYTDDENDHRFESAQGTTAAEAICLAAHKAAEAE